jgi:hypothetical protein
VVLNKKLSAYPNSNADSNSPGKHVVEPSPMAAEEVTSRIETQVLKAIEELVDIRDLRVQK